VTISNRRTKCAGFGFSLRSLLKPIPNNVSTVLFKELWETEWSLDFEECCRHRLVMGSFRYGRLNAPGKPSFDRVTCAINRLRKYQDTHNLEHLMDASNMCMLEFEEGRHPDRHFQPQDDTTHTEIIK